MRTFFFIIFLIFIFKKRERERAKYLLKGWIRFRLPQNSAISGSFAFRLLLFKIQNYPSLLCDLSK
uniref:Uncharacterized protein n=1 Tax=Meloidogyne enterolobii TaxID=390850 RepID=A0A6V7V4J1_MELEN|nr:unnamed protein product [Meloidogyne enterolobii]